MTSNINNMSRFDSGLDKAAAGTHAQCLLNDHRAKADY